jgi:hypothetical protein
MRLGESILVLIATNAHHEIGSDDAAAHMASEEKGQTAEHLPFRDLRSVLHQRADAIRQ